MSFLCHPERTSPTSEPKGLHKERGLLFSDRCSIHRGILRLATLVQNDRLISVPLHVTLSEGVRRPSRRVSSRFVNRCSIGVVPSFGGFFDSLRSLRMTVVFVVAVLFTTPAAGIANAADDVVVRSSVTPAEAWVGQRTLLHIEVLGVDGWAQITDMGELEIPGTYVMRIESQGTRLSETIGGTSYTGQRYQLSLYCQRPGRVEIPALPATVTVKRWGATPPEIRREVTIPATALICKVPPGAEGIRDLISTTRLEADQTWSSEPTTVDLGDAVTRTVSLRAEDVSGMAFPPMQHPEIEGVGIYPGEPSVTDTTDRGSLRGERVESVTYVLEEPGEVSLPGIVLSWWDIDDGVLRRIELPGLELAVEGELAPEPVIEPEVVPAMKPRDFAPLAAAAIVLVGLGLWLGPRLARGCRRWWIARRASEPVVFKKVLSTMRSGDPATISAAVMRWLDRLDPGDRPARLDLFLRDHGDDATQAAAATLAQCMATGDAFSDSRALSGGLKASRRHLLRSRLNQQKTAGVLPELNG